MIQNQLIIRDEKNNPLKLKALRMANYVRAQFIEAISEKQELYYLFYYESEFLTAKKVTKLRRHSLIERAFKNGLTFQAPHPFIHLLSTSNPSSKIINNKQLLRKLNQHFSKQEKAYILTFFESFISKKQLFNEIKDMFYEDRRGGQLFSAYRLIRIMKDFAPNHSLVKSLSSDLIYKDFAKMYYDRTEELFQEDLIEAEKIMFHELNTYGEKLSNQLEIDHRWLELVMWRSLQLKASPEPHVFESLQFTLKQHFSEHESISVLEQLAQDVTYSPLQEHLFSKYLETNQVDKVSQLIKQNQHLLSPQDLDQISQTLSEKTPSELNIPIESLQILLIQVLKQRHDLAENLLHKYIGDLLTKHELSTIHKWLEPFREVCGELKVIEKFDRIYQMSEDLDHMQSLGELYYEFKQWKQALECFSMESELKPDEAKPLKWLSKTYLELGMKDESDAYQKMYIQIQKQA